MLQIQRSMNDGIVFTLVGQIETEHLSELQRLFELENVTDHIALNLQDVTLIDRDAVKFLARCEADRIELQSCPAYIRAWIDRETTPNGRGSS
jgi:ABC-type transporter Mla MlaB component